MPSDSSDDSDREEPHQLLDRIVNFLATYLP